MKQFSEFVIKHWDIIASCIMVVASVVVMVIRKKPVLNEMDNILLKVLEKLPDWIKTAENLKGAEVKKTLVLESAKKYVKDTFNVNLSDSYIDFIGSAVESILSTPQKK